MAGHEENERVAVTMNRACTDRTGRAMEGMWRS